MVLVNAAQAKEFALSIKDDIKAYIKAHQAEYQEFLKQQETAAVLSNTKKEAV